MAASAVAAEAASVATQGLAQAAAVVMGGQVQAAILAERAVALMLDQQDIAVPPPRARLNPAAFTTPPENFERMASETDTDAEFERLVASIIQETARVAQETAIAARDDVEHVRHLILPSCSRCVALGGRVYRYSEGFRRHPGCDCVMIPVTVASPNFAYDPLELARDGQVTDLSKADRRAVDDGADFGQVVNVRRRAAGLTRAGRVLERAGRPTPEAIYQVTGDDRAAAVDLFARYGYLQ